MPKNILQQVKICKIWEKMNNEENKKFQSIYYKSIKKFLIFGNFLLDALKLFWEKVELFADNILWI